MSETMSPRRISVRGMTCAACEAKVARELSGIDGVDRATVSALTGQATVCASKPVSDEAIAAAVRRAGYQVTTGRRPWLSRDGDVWRDVAVGLGFVLLIALAMGATGALGHIDRLVAAASGGSLALIVALGVAASLSSCMALTGGLVVSLSARYAVSHPAATTVQRLEPQLAFNAGRIAGFAAFGAVLGAIGSLVRLTPTLTAVLMVAVAVVMGALGLALSGVCPRLAGVVLHLPSGAGTWARRGGRAQLGQGARPYRSWRAAGAGAASFFLPCGFTQAVQVLAAATGRPGQAAAIMALFALGTAPGLIAAGSLASLARGPKARHVYRVLGVIVIAFAAVNLSSALTTLAPAAIMTPSASGDEQVSANVTIEGGVQRVHTEHNADGYVPAVTTIRLGMPVIWTVTSSVTNCGSAMNLASLGLGTQQLALGENTFEFTPGQPGDLPYACTMGMMTARFRVIP